MGNAHHLNGSFLNTRAGSLACTFPSFSKGKRDSSVVFLENSSTLTLLEEYRSCSSPHGGFAFAMFRRSTDKCFVSPRIIPEGTQRILLHRSVNKGKNGTEPYSAILVLTRTGGLGPKH
jgi:hypothetical protein